VRDQTRNSVLHTLNIRLFPEQLIFVTHQAQDKEAGVSLTCDGRRDRSLRRDLGAIGPCSMLRVTSVTPAPEQLDALDAAGATVTGQRFADLNWVSAGRE
jgi:hypothetical protein